jgi:hypothetical protein
MRVDLVPFEDSSLNNDLSLEPVSKRFHTTQYHHPGDQTLTHGSLGDIPHHNQNMAAETWIFIKESMLTWSS